MKSALFPGTFDPPSFGHLDIIKKACQFCDQLIIGIAHKPGKKEVFSVEERKEMLQLITSPFPNVEIENFHGLAVDFAKKKNALLLIRGLRAFSDFEVEFQMALANRRISGLETLFLMADEHHTHISSSLIREIAYFQGPLSDFVPPEIESLIRKKYKGKGVA